MFGTLWLSEPKCKENDFDVEAHIKKEEFLRHQLLKERKSGHEHVSKVKKQNQDLKLHAKLALTGLQERIRALENENVKLREEKYSYLGSIKESVEEMLATVRHNGNDQLTGGDTRAREFLTVSEKLLNGLSQLTDQNPPKEVAGDRSAVETSNDSYEIPQAVLDSLENQNQNITSTLHESGPKTPNRVRSIVQRFELSREEGVRALAKGGDDHFGENSPTPNGDLGSPNKGRRNQQKMNAKDKSAKKDRFFSEDSMELSKTQGLDHELRQKDEEIRDLTEQLAKANIQIASLQQDLQERKSVTLPQAQAQPQPQQQQAVYLDDLLDVEKFQNQIFATCALSLLFTLVLLGIVEANEVVIGQSTDLSISQIKDDNGRSQRVLDFPQTVDLSVCDGDYASRPLSVDDLSTNRHETLPRATSSSSDRRSLSYSLEKEIFKKTIQLFTDRNSQLLKENDDMRRKMEREVSKRRRLLIENATLFDRLSKAKRRDLKPVVCDDSCQTENLPTETKEVQCEAETVQGQPTVLEEKLKSMKKAMKERAAQSIEKIKSLQQEISVLTNQNEALTVQLQHVESKTFESQVELQEAKQQYRAVSEEKKKLKDNYRSQMKEYQKQYDGKCREVKKLQDMLISDKEKFRKLRDSMKKIAHLKTALFDDSSTQGGADDSTLSVNISNIDDGNVTMDSQSSSSRCGIPDLELHRMYSEEIRKRIDVKDKAEEESLLSELSLIDERLQDNLRACTVAGGEGYDQNDDVSKLWDRLKSLQDALEAKQDECVMMQEELIFLRSKVHLYEVLNANSVSMTGSPLSPHSRQSLCISPMLLDDEPSLHRDRKGEIRMLRLKIIDLEAMVITLQQEKETMKSLTASLYPKSSAEGDVAKGVSTIDSMHEVVASLDRSVHEYREKYEAMKGTVEELSADRLFYRNELETERRNTLNLLAELCRLPNQECDQTSHSSQTVAVGDFPAPTVATVEELTWRQSPQLPAEEKQKLLLFYDALYSRTMRPVEGCMEQDKFESF